MWRELFKFLDKFSPFWIAVLLVCSIMSYRAPDIIHAILTHAPINDTHKSP
jgi:hypothetical protein